MEEARQVLERLARISDLERDQASPSELLGELKELVREAEIWLRAEPGAADAELALARCREALTVEDDDEVLLLAN